MATLRDLRTNVQCPRCKKVYHMTLSPIKDYSLTCEECDEDFYGIEIKEFLGEYFEIYINMTMEEYENIREELKDKFKNASFIGYDNEVKVCDISYENIPEEKELKEIIKYFNPEEIVENDTTQMLYTTYSEELDVTFIMEDTIQDDDIIKTEVKGFYYGNPNDEDTEYYYNKLCATFR